MEGNIVDLEAHRRRKRPAKGRPVRATYGWPGRSPLDATPMTIRHMRVRYFDMPDDPPLVKLAWLLSHCGEVPLPDGESYRLERGRLEWKRDGRWVVSCVTFDELARRVGRLQWPQWQYIALRCRPRKKVFDLNSLQREDQWTDD
jgi:hypothetical protein